MNLSGKYDASFDDEMLIHTTDEHHKKQDESKQIMIKNQSATSFADEMLPTKATSHSNIAKSDHYIPSIEQIGDCSLFVKKTYFMINTCNTEIAQWSTDGSYFIIKDHDTFSRTIIPQFFDHNNFQSFVRQLNFYGFTKMRPNIVKTLDPTIQCHRQHTYFRHDNFIRDKPNALKKICPARKPKSNKDPKEVENLKSELKSVKDCIAITSGKIQMLRSFVLDLTVKFDELERNKTYKLNNHKRRRINLDQDMPVKSTITSDIPSSSTLMTSKNTSYNDRQDQKIQQKTDSAVNKADDMSKNTFESTQILPDDCQDSSESPTVMDVDDVEIFKSIMSENEDEDSDASWCDEYLSSADVLSQDIAPETILNTNSNTDNSVSIPCDDAITAGSSKGNKRLSSASISDADLDLLTMALSDQTDMRHCFKDRSHSKPFSSRAA